jgi:hypothetical protein
MFLLATENIKSRSPEIHSSFCVFSSAGNGVNGNNLAMNKLGGQGSGPVESKEHPNGGVSVYKNKYCIK